MAALPEANQHVHYDDSQNSPVFAEPPKDIPIVPQMPSIPSESTSDWKPINNRNPLEFGPIGSSNHFPTHHRFRRFAKEYDNRFDPNFRGLNGGSFGSNSENSRNLPNFMSYHLGSNTHSYTSAPNYQNYFTQNLSPYSNTNSFSNFNSQQTPPQTHHFSGNSNLFSFKS